MSEPLYTSRHWGVEEWDCYHRTRNRYAWNNEEGFLCTDNLATAKLFMILDSLRDCDSGWKCNDTTYKEQFGMSLKSGYRDEEVNNAVGGVVGSYHTKGCAIDMHNANYYYTDEQIVESIESVVSWYDEDTLSMDELGIGCYGDWVHLDVRGYKSRW